MAKDSYASDSILAQEQLDKSAEWEANTRGLLEQLVNDGMTRLHAVCVCVCVYVCVCVCVCVDAHAPQTYLVQDWQHGTKMKPSY